MAIAIKSIPILLNNDAEKFVEKADNSYRKKNSIDFSEQVKIANNILEKAKMK